ncbi:MAG: hypothetical protein V3R70_11580, partial [Syntrophobacteria bacterium]
FNPNVTNLLRGRTRQSVTEVAARRLGEDEAYFTVREILAAASTVADGALSRERSGFYRCGFATLGLTFPQPEIAARNKRRLLCQGGMTSRK